MNIKHISSEELKSHVRRVVARHLDLDNYKVFFFGSRVRGDNFERADIDIGIEGAEELKPAIKLAIKEDLERLSLLYKIDLVDFRQVSDTFKNEAMKYVEFI